MSEPIGRQASKTIRVCITHDCITADWWLKNYPGTCPEAKRSFSGRNCRYRLYVLKSRVKP